MSDLEPGVQIAPDTIAAMERLSTPPSTTKLTMNEQHKSPTWDHWAELTARVEALEATQRPRVFTAEEASPIVAPTVKDSLTSPASSLVERVGQVISDVVPDEDGFDLEARAAIREVAEWLRAESEGHFGSGLHWAQRLDQEATR